MTDKFTLQPQEGEHVQLNEPRLRPHSHWSLMWLLPLLALVLSAWLGWRSYSESGMEIRITFPTAEGIEVGITPVRYLGMEVGKVSAIELTDDRSQVQVVVRMKRQVSDMLNDHTLFWLVSPKASLAGVSGLDTLVTGNYIRMRAGQGQPSRTFTALIQPPLNSHPEDALQITLTAENAGSLRPGAPVYFRKIAVGEIQAVDLIPGEEHVTIQLFIEPDYAELVKNRSRFWNASGITVNADLSGVKITSESLSSLLTGGIAFSSPADSVPVALGGNHRFMLYDDVEAANAGTPITLYLPDGASVTPGRTEIHYRNVKLGYIDDINLDPWGQLTATARMDPRAAPLLRSGSQLWLPEPGISLSQLSKPTDLLLGSPIQLEPGAGSPQDVFEVQIGKPQSLLEAEGAHYHLVTDDVSRLSVGSPLYYRGLKIGSVSDISYQARSQQFEVTLMIEQRYRQLVRENSQFWNSGGIRLSGNLQGFSMSSTSLESLAIGGISLSEPDLTSPVAKPEKSFTLYADKKSIDYTGPEIQLHLADTQGLSIGSPLRYRGVVIGEVTAIGLSDDLSHVVVNARLTRDNTEFARQGARFRVQKAELSALVVKNLDSLLSGPWILAEPGDGPMELSFYLPGVDHKQAPSRDPLRLSLIARQLGSVTVGSRIIYRQVPVGEVTAIRLGPAADRVIIDIAIEPRFRVLVRHESRFWKASGLTAEFGLFSGAKVKADSLQSLLQSGISLATPEDSPPSSLAENGRQFALYDEPDPEWLRWQPVIPLPPE